MTVPADEFEFSAPIYFAQVYNPKHCSGKVSHDKSMKKPVVAFIAGGAAPKGKKMGHAGAIVMGDKGSYASKRSALEAAGVTVLDTPSDVGTALKTRLAR